MILKLNITINIGRLPSVFRSMYIQGDNEVKHSYGKGSKENDRP